VKIEAHLKKFQKIYFLLLLGMLTIQLAAGNYSGYDSSICSPKLCRSTSPFEWSAALLYLKPNVDDSHYVLSSFNNVFNGSLFPKGQRHQNCASFTPGVSIEGLYDIDPHTSCLDLRLTYFNACSTNAVSGDFLYDTNGYPGFGAQDSPVYRGTARSKNLYNFYSGDLTYNRTLMSFFPDNFIFIAGLHAAYIKFKEHTTSLGTFSTDQGPRPISNNLNRNSQFYGIGPQFGLDYQFLLPGCRFFRGTWAFKAKTRGSLLCGNTKSDLSYVTLRTGPGGVGVDNGGLWRITPSANTELSINYSLNRPCFRMTVELGYKLMWYNKCVNKITGTDVAFSGDTIDVFNDFSLQGPYLRLGCAF